MKKLLIFLTFIVLTNFVNGQLDSNKLDTIRVFFHATDTFHYFDYYKANGVLLWKNVKGYDPALIPPGGRAEESKYSKPPFSIISGFAVIRSDSVGNIRIIRKLNLSYKDIKDKWIDNIINLR